MIYEFNIDQEIYRKFALALQLNNEIADKVVETLFIEYTRNSFLQVAETLPVVKRETFSQKKELYSQRIDHAKALRKIPTWAYKNHQNNHKIIKAFLLIKEEQDYVNLVELKMRCENQQEYPETYVTDFKGNFAQMKTDAANSHGKIFVVTGEHVTLWDQIEDCIMKYSDDFIVDRNMDNTEVQENSNTSINREMIQVSYQISTLVFQGKVSRQRGKQMIAEKTTMNIGSAQDYITVFLAMMSGDCYKRTINITGTEYFITSIKKDFGFIYFKKALTACQSHINYYNNLGYGKQVKTQLLVDKFSKCNENDDKND